MPSRPFKPDYAVSPGQVLQIHLDSHELSVAEFAKRCGRPVEFISDIISGSAPLDGETALLFEKEFALCADAWLAVEAKYRRKLAREEEKRARGKGIMRLSRIFWKIISRTSHGLGRNRRGVPRGS